MIGFSDYLKENYLGGDIPNIDEGMKYQRANQPQIDDMDAFTNDLDDSGVMYYTMLKPTESLIPTQVDYNDDKVMSIISDIRNQNKPIVVSNDNYIADGHHRWLAHDEVSGKVNSHVVDMPLDELHDFLNGKPYVSQRGINEDLEMEPVDDDYLQEAEYEGKKVQLYKPAKRSAGKSTKYSVYVKEKGQVARKGFMGVKKRRIEKVMNKMLSEGAYVDNLRRQLIDLLRLRLNIADISTAKYSDILQQQIDEIMSLSPSKILDMYNDQVVNNKVDDIKNLHEGFDLHREVALANDHDSIIKTYQHFRDNPFDRRIHPLVTKSTRGMFQSMATSGHPTDAFIAAKYGDHTVRDGLKKHENAAVRFEAAQSPNTHADLSNDHEDMVRYNVAKHAVDHKILRKLAGDANIHVAQMALARSKEIGNTKHSEVFTKHQAAHNRQNDDLRMSDLHPKFQDEVRDAAMPEHHSGWVAPVIAYVRKKWKGIN